MPSQEQRSSKSLGPFGLGDPDDKSLRKVEIEVLVPKIMRDRAKNEKCQDVVKEFEKCCKSHSFMMVVKCREENSALKACLTRWYQDEDFKKECTDIYLRDRSYYRRTGMSRAKAERLGVSM